MCTHIVLLCVSCCEVVVTMVTSGASGMLVIMIGGAESDIRVDVWKFLYDLYPFHSTIL